MPDIITDTVIKVKVRNIEYYLYADKYYDLVYIDGYLTNISNNNITLRQNFNDNTTYPYISCPQNNRCRLYSNNTSNYSYITTSDNYQLISNFNFNMLKSSMINQLIFMLLLLILGFKLLFKRW